MEVWQMQENENQLVFLEKRDNVAVVTLNRPERRNALSPLLLLELARVLKELAEEDLTRCLVIRGTGDKAFSAGYDIGAIPTDLTAEMAELLKDNPNPLETALEAVASFPYPVIAMLNGVAVGAGCELAITCDIRIGVEDLRMGMPPAKLGIVYAPSGMRKFINTVGLANTKELFFTGEYVGAERAREMGLVNYVVPRDELEPFTFSMAEGIAANAPLSLKGSKRILGLLLGYQEIGPEANQEALQLIGEAFMSEDLKEGQRAFMEKRKPSFHGR
jgi:enoyl-CoA hydratase/carnithine racemase